MDKKNDKQEDLAQAVSHSDAGVQSTDKLVDWEDVAKRALADLDNYKKDEERRRLGLASIHKSCVFVKLLPIVNDLRRAIHFIDNGSAREGLLAVMQKMIDLFESEGFKVLEPQEGEVFDPTTSEAISYEESSLGSGEVIETVEIGMISEGIVMQPAKVRVGK
jgi:molecular chaperone GrpE